MQKDAKKRLRCNVRIWQLVQTRAKGSPDKSDGLVIWVERSASPERGKDIACPFLRAQAKQLGPCRKGGKNLEKKIARGEGHLLLPRKHAGLRLPGTKSRGGCEKLLDLSARSDEFRIINREDGWFRSISRKDRWFQSISWKDRWFWSIDREVIVTRY